MLRWPTKEEQEQAIRDNIRFVYYIVNKLSHVPQGEYDEYVQIGSLGLLKAVQTYDTEKKAAFSTYAGKCIQNELYMVFRRRGKLDNEVLFTDVTYYAGSEYEDMEIENALTDGNDLTDSVMNSMEFVDIINIILNVLDPREAVIILYHVSGTYKQKEVARRLGGISQSYVSRVLHRTTEKVRKYVEQWKKNDDSAFSFSKEGTRYKLRCNTEMLTRCLGEFLQKTSNKVWKDFTVNEQMGCGQVFLISHHDMFDFLADLLIEIYKL